MAFQDYQHSEIEKKWQERWEKAKLFEARDDLKKEKCYVLVEFPYPSGAGLHVGHPRSYTALDVVARKKRMEGKNVLFPMGWDAFGLPAENYALKTGIHPSVETKKNIDTFRRQLKSLGFSFDWSREVDTTDPAYYKWTQWMFLEFFKAGLAYKSKTMINWCPKDKTGLANEEVVNGCCERCGTPTEKREKEQWMIAITKYADRLIDDLKTVDYLPKIKKQQEDWIGRSEGAEIDFLVLPAQAGIHGSPTPVGDDKSVITVFTTRPDTLFGVTYVVLAPEHPLVEKITTQEQLGAVNAYVAEAKKKTDLERGDETKKKSGVFTGAYTVNPANGEKVPVWVADYVLGGYGTGAVMAVPAHDERDYEFAKAFGLRNVEVVMPHCIDESNPPRKDKKTITRRMVHGIIRDPKTNKVLCLKWKKQPWTSFVIGGADEGEDVIVAVKREIHEETGYKNLKLIKVLGGVVQSEYYAAHKDENRLGFTTGVYFELENEARDPMSPEEQEKHELVWRDWKDITRQTMTCSEVNLWRERINSDNLAYAGEGIMTNSGEFNGLTSKEAASKIVAKVGGRKVVKFKLRDWVFSRQRYWGEPIPLVHCQSGCAPETGGWVAVPEKDLPVKLPEVQKYEPTDTGESPLAAIKSFVETTCPQCGGKAKRETDTMPNWAGSSWYFLRYIDPKNDKVFADAKKLKHWMPVDLYNGGMEHTTLHLLYSRFWNKFLFDRGHVPCSEPYTRRHSHGLIMAEDGTKMSKSKGNVVNPDDIVNEFGADTLRMYLLFMGPFEEPVPWSTNGVVGVRRFLEKVKRYVENWTQENKKSINQENNNATAKLIEKTAKKVGDDIEGFRFNTAVSALMILFNELPKMGTPTKEQLERVLIVLAPFAPHLASEMYELIGGQGFVEERSWPTIDATLLKDETSLVVVQINGKLRDQIEVQAGVGQDEVVKVAEASEKLKGLIAGKKIAKIVYVPGKILNLVIPE